MAKTDNLIIIDRTAIEETKDELRAILEMLGYSIETLFALRELTEEIAAIVYGKMEDETDDQD